MAEEKSPLRLGEWFEQNRWMYVTTVECDRVEVSNNGYDKDLKFTRVRLQVVDSESMVRMFKDYDKHVDDNLVL